MKLVAIAAFTLGAAWPLSALSSPGTGRQFVTAGPDADPAARWQLVANASKGSPAVWWQFVTNGPNGERQVSPHFAKEEDCQRALKAVEELLAKKFPHHFPLVGSCESYR